MNVIRKMLWSLLAFPAAAVLIALAVANRHSVTLKLDPFKPEAPVLALDMPFYAYLFAALFAGIALGGIAVWLGQGKWRKRLRERTSDAANWRAEAARLRRDLTATEAQLQERASGAAARAIAAPGRQEQRRLAS